MAAREKISETKIINLRNVSIAFKITRRNIILPVFTSTKINFKIMHVREVLLMLR